jgi:hypothetical protein
VDAATGYGRASDANRRVLGVHRIVYELLVGPIPAGMTLDHTCHNAAAERGECAGGSCPHRRCCNPRHLEPVTSAENFRRSPLSNANKVVCHKGHPSRERRTAKGGRECLTCKAERQRRYYAEAKR